MLRTDRLNILIIDSGARGHAIGWACKKSPRCRKLYFAPGNAGTAKIGDNIPGALEVENLVAFAKWANINLVIVGPEGPLDAGIVDILRIEGIPVVGPTKRAAQLETSKVFAKTLMRDIGVPTAPFRIFTEHGAAIDYVRTQQRPLFVKASGLCGGKGAFPCHTVEAAEEVLYRLMVQRTLGDAANEVVIEDFLEGDEASFHVFTNCFVSNMAPVTQDHKRLLDDGAWRSDGTNPNTGGMGAIGPVPGIHIQRIAVQKLIVEPVLEEMQRRGMPYTGILYPGVMLTKQGPQVLEFNVRGGDPETQVLMRLLKSDAVDLFEMIAAGTLDEKEVEWHEDLHAATITLAARGYPEKPEKGSVISGIEEAEKLEGVVVFHAGTRTDVGFPIVDGGRVLSVSATGKNLFDALIKAYDAVKLIHFDGMHYRTDIGLKQVRRYLESDEVKNLPRLPEGLKAPTLAELEALYQSARNRA